MAKDFLVEFIAQAKATAQPWPFQDILDGLVSRGFAEIDEAQTWRFFEERKHLMYKFTDAGKEACFRYRHSLPMGWAQDIQKGKTRHCVICFRDCHRKKVWAQSGRFRTVCMDCGAQGHGLLALAQTPEERQEALAYERRMEAMEAIARGKRVCEFPAPEDLPDDWGDEYCKSASVEENAEYEAWLGWKSAPKAEDY